MKIVLSKEGSTSSTYTVIIIAIGFIVALLTSSSPFSGIMSAASSSSDSSSSDSSTVADGGTDATTDDGGKQFSNVGGGDQMPLTPPMDNQQPPVNPDSGTTAATTPTTPGSQQQQQQSTPLTPSSPTDDSTVAGSGNANPLPGLEGLFSGVPPGSPPPFVTIPDKPEQINQPTDTTSPESKQQQQSSSSPTHEDIVNKNTIVDKNTPGDFVAENTPRIGLEELFSGTATAVQEIRCDVDVDKDNINKIIEMPNGPTITQCGDALGSIDTKWPNTDKQLFYRNDGYLSYNDGKGNEFVAHVDGSKFLYNEDRSYFVVLPDGSKFLIDANGKVLFSSPPSPPKAK
jgi:hypothetical protein